MNYKHYFTQGAHWNNWLNDEIKQDIADHIGVELEKLNNATATEKELEKAKELTDLWLEGRNFDGSFA